MAEHHVKQMRKLMPFDGATIGYFDIKKIAKRLDLDEDCLAATVVTPVGPGGNGNGVGVICATTRRLIYAAGLVPPFSLQEFPYGRINAIDLSYIGAFGVGKGLIKVNSGGAVFDFKVTDIAGGQRVVDAVRRQLYAPSPQGSPSAQPAPPVAPPPEDPLAMLEALSALRTEGLISDDEFESKKQELLTRI